jgi:hypothetical protein
MLPAGSPCIQRRLKRIHEKEEWCPKIKSSNFYVGIQERGQKMTDLQRNQSHGDPIGYHQDAHINASGNAKHPPVDTGGLTLTITPAAAHALLALLIGVRRKRARQVNPGEGT